MSNLIYFKTESGVDAVKVTGIPKLDIFKTFDCGQCFRFDPVSIFGNKYEYGGVAFGKYVVFAQNCDTEIIIYGASEDDYNNIWYKFLSLDVDYEKINRDICFVVNSDDMTKAVEYGSGIRILRQDAWECIISFIISQNNNIPRIKKIIREMCEKYGEEIAPSKYAFPTVDALYSAGQVGMAELKTGFRAKYLFDACEKAKNGILDIEKIRECDSFDECVKIMCQVKGIGLKVASCALLFGFEKTQAFPVDVWMKRALEKYFPNGLDLDALGKNAGIAQQYLFYYEKYRQNP